MTSSESIRVPLTICWHCDRPLDAAMDPHGDREPCEGAISLCLYCGAVGVFGPDLMLRPPTEAELDEYSEMPEFRKEYTQFIWARQYLMIRENLMRDRSDPDR